MPKIVFFWICLGVIWVFGGFSWWLVGKLEISFNRVAIFLLGGMLAIFMLATGFSEFSRISFWGEYVRRDGLFLFLSFVMLFFAVIFFFPKERLKEFLKVVCYGGAVVSLTVLVGVVYPLAWSGWGYEEFLGRGFGTMGHPSYLGYYLIFVIAVWAFLLREERGRAWKALGLLMALALIFSGSKAAVLALLVMAVIGGLPGVKKGKLRFRLVGVALLLLVSVLGMRALESEDFFRSFESRLLMWETSLELAVERPILGFGPATFGEGFQRKCLLSLLNMKILVTFRRVRIIGRLICFLSKEFWGH
ncbi:MAG: O-antigen ligase family protein [Candidatus Curtissbacteria bacterium]|nr:O-antigen ligase family protein [Candidatus Curtissbacteria bacterium]